MTAVFNFLMIAGAIQGFVFNIATFLARKKIEKPVLFLNLFVFFLSFNNLQSWLIDKGFITQSYYTLPWYVLLAPMFYAFLIYYLGIERKRETYFILAVTIFVLELTARGIMIFMVQKGFLNEEHIIFYNAIEDAVTLLFSVFIFSKVLQVLFRYQHLYTSILSFDDLKWVKRFVQLGGLILILWAIAVLLNFVSETINPPYNYYPLRLGTSILIYWIGYQGFFRYVVLQDRIGLRRAIRKDETSQKVVDKDGLQNIQKNAKGESSFNDIDSYIVTNQKYLDPYLSLENLSEELEIGSSSLSKLINTHAQNSFPDYINALRVKEATKLLSDTSFSSYTIVAIGLECGFNSKSTFYTAFKKFTGQTPTTYRNSISP